MKQITKIILLAIVGVLATTVTSAEDVERAVDASSDGNVSISNIAGSIDVIAWQRAEVSVLADLGRDVEELIVERHGDDVIVKVKVPNPGDRVLRHRFRQYQRHTGDSQPGTGDHRSRPGLRLPL